MNWGDRRRSRPPQPRCCRGDGRCPLPMACLQYKQIRLGPRLAWVHVRSLGIGSDRSRRSWAMVFCMAVRSPVCPLFCTLSVSVYLLFRIPSVSVYLLFRIPSVSHPYPVYLLFRIPSVSRLSPSVMPFAAPRPQPAPSSPPRDGLREISQKI